MVSCLMFIASLWAAMRDIEARTGGTLTDGAALEHFKAWLVRSRLFTSDGAESSARLSVLCRADLVAAMDPVHSSLPGPAPGLAARSMRLARPRRQVKSTTTTTSSTAPRDGIRKPRAAAIPDILQSRGSEHPAAVDAHTAAPL
jgi:hypothetical protein